MTSKQPGTSGVLLGSGCLFLFGLIVFVFAAAIAVVTFPAMRVSAAAGLLALVVLVFAAVGIGLMVMAWKNPGRAREQRQRKARHPDQPWLWREDWEQGFARAEGRNHARFRMAPMPGVQGGKLHGLLETGGAGYEGNVELVLSCILWKPGYRSGSSEILWQDQATAEFSPGPDGAQATVEFEIPFDTRPTENDAPGYVARVFWRLAARSADGKFHASFVVPVFPTAGSDSSRTRERLEAHAGLRLGGYTPAQTRIAKVITPEGIQYHFPRARNRSIAAMASLFGLIFLGIAFVLGLQVNHWLALGALAGLLLAGAIGSLTLLMAVWLWFAETTVVAATGELRIHTSCLGISRTRIVRADEIRGFEIKPGMQKGSEVWYDVCLEVAAGKPANAGTGMDKTEAEWFVAEIRNDLGLR